MIKGIFITGTDTGVGKTFIAAGLIRAMKDQGINVCPMKPVESGCSIKKGELVPEDAVRLISASGVNETLDAVNPCRLQHALAPSVAAEIEGVKIHRKKLLNAYYRLQKKYDITIVEGAGGIMVPVYKKYLFLDLATDLNLPVLIVSRPGLGTINHTLLTIEAARSRGLHILGVIVNFADRAERGLPERTNPGVIKKLGRVPLLGIVPHGEEEATLRSGFSMMAASIYAAMNKRTRSAPL